MTSEYESHLYIPTDFSAPDWSDDSRVHNWKNYIGDWMKAHWWSFSEEQKAHIAGNA